MTDAPPLVTHILVVDDEPLITSLVADLLEADGHEVDTAANGRLALEQIERRSYDLILSDLRMPELDGLALYRELERRQSDLLPRMVFISGTLEHPEYKSFLEQTGVPVLSKPFDLEDLRRFTERFLPAA